MAITNEKPWYASKTVIGAVVAGVAGLLAVFKVGWAGNVPGESESIASVVEQIAVVVGALVALWGRLTATTTLTK